MMIKKIAYIILVLVVGPPVVDNISLAQEMNAEKPNILIILTDDQGYHDVSYSGTEDIQTPNIDQLVSSGMRFDNFYANSSVCSPTRAALITGRYPDLVGVPGVVRAATPANSWGYLNPEAVSLPHILRQNGYNTALVGKWHLGMAPPNLPNNRGFDIFHGWLYGMMDDYRTHRKNGINYMRLNEKTIDPKGHATNLFSRWAMEYIEEQEQVHQPFFLYLAYTAPHAPVQPPKEWLQKVEQREPGLSKKRAKLVALIEHMDDGIGKVIQALKKSDQYENTLIIFTSDNGGKLQDKADNGPLRDGKGSMYEGGIKVPMGIAWPGNIQSGSHTDRIALTMDLFPTLLDAAGINYEGPIEGQSFLPTLLGADQPEENRPLFFTRREGWVRYGGQTIWAVRLGDWKLLQNNPFNTRELYNLKEDPLEENNLADEEPEKFRELNALMMKHIQKGGKIPWQKPVGE